MNTQFENWAEKMDQVNAEDQQRELDKRWEQEEQKLPNPELSIHIMPEFVKSFAKLQRAAKRLGVAEPQYKIIREFPKKVGERIVYRENKQVREPILKEYFEIEITGDAPKLSDWEFVSKVDFSVSETVGVFATVPSLTVPQEFFSAPSTRCDHCNRKHKRKTCYVVSNEEKGFKFVGSSCLKDFLGHANPDSVARFWSWYETLEQLLAEQDTEEYSKSVPSVYELQNVLERAAVAIRLYGWRGANHEDECTRSFVATGLAPIWFPPKITEAERKEIQDEWNALNEIKTEDVNEARATMEWLNTLQHGSNDYENNLVNVREIGFVNYKSMGLAVSAVKVALEKERKQSEREKQNELFSKSVHVGEIKKRQLFEGVKLIKVKSYMGNDFMTGAPVAKYVYTFLTDNDCVLIAFPTSKLNCEEGDTVSFKATPKKHDEFNGVAQTTINRITF